MKKCNDDARKDAAEFVRQFSPTDGVDYGWISGYAEWLYSYRVSNFDAIDGKADAIIRYLGGGTGLFALGIITQAGQADHWRVALASLPSFLAAIIAVAMACYVRRPAGFGGLPTVRHAVEYADKYKSESVAKTKFLAQWNFACEGVRVACDQKADILEKATWLYWFAIAGLILPAIVATVVGLKST